MSAEGKAEIIALVSRLWIAVLQSISPAKVTAEHLLPLAKEAK